ncbi:poly(U)-specific endoribonuclease homolog [Copidosoma floridanum]|uniref:poly(U)-specific endoribonuclease homolog n=1 Tax=Copidosoma floridanum TaxID=29053 RepID=UPI0006C95BC1|nr:poly(U)-specific endoribonuclease homolog [Copidosoma floridanum]
MPLNTSTYLKQASYTVKPEAFEIPTIKSFLSIYQKYYQKSGVEKIETKVELNDQKLLIETFLNTTVLSTAMGFLGEKGFVKNDFDEYKKSLRNLWFEPYNAFVHRFFGHRTPRFSTPDYSKGRTFSNWITMHLEEKKQKMVKNVSPMMTQSLKSYNGENTAITFHFYKIFGNQTLESLPTKTMCILLGTSPELEMALYTVCAYMSLDGHCNIVDFIASENNISWLNVTCAVD